MYAASSDYVVFLVLGDMFDDSGVWVWDWTLIHSDLLARALLLLSSRHHLFTHYPFPPRSLVCGGQPSPHKPRLVVLVLVLHSCAVTVSSTGAENQFQAVSHTTILPRAGCVCLLLQDLLQSCSRGGEEESGRHVL